MSERKCKEAIKSLNDNPESVKGLDTSGIGFSEIIDNDMLYIDKTLLIDDILRTNNRGVFLYTRPRRFGKTTNLSMLQEYFDVRRRGTHRFDGLAISRPEYSRHEVHRNAYNVVRIDLKGCNPRTYDSFIESIGYIIAEVFGKQLDAIDRGSLTQMDVKQLDRIAGAEATESMLVSSLQLLSRILHASNGLRTVILVDEYDAPITYDLDNPHQREILAFLSGFLSSAFKSNDHVQLGVITGIPQMAKENMFSKLNNVVVNNIFSLTSDERYGFTESEVKAVLEDRECLEQFGKVKEWYDGYRFGNADVYNPYAIINFAITGKEFKRFWAGNNSGPALRMLFSSLEADTFEKISGLLKGGEIEHEMDSGVFLDDLAKGSLTTVLSVMAMSGYLKAVPTGTDDVYTLSIPNYEVWRSVKRVLDDMGPASERRISMMREAVFKNDAEALCGILEDILACESYFDLVDEKDYQQILMTAMFLVSRDSEVRTQREAGSGRLDIVMTSDGCPSVIFELKRSIKEADLVRDAEEGLRQIHERRYYAGLEGDVILYGISFWSKFPCVRSEAINLEDKG